MSINTETLNFWKEEYRDDYMKKNAEFDSVLGVEAWKLMVKNTQSVSSIVECGCNIGRNIDFLQQINPDYDISAIDVNEKAINFVKEKYNISDSFVGRIEDASFKNNKYDLAFTMGVLIHVHPDELLATAKKVVDMSKKYVLIGEYFNRTPTMIPYQGKENLLFKRDFGKYFLENFDLEVIDYGFLWGHYYDVAGFDDFTWWLFKKNES